jgi:hypothetical protein
MFVILTMIVLVGALNIISTLVLVVMEKNRVSRSDYFGTTAYKPIATLVVDKLNQIRQYKIEQVLDTYSERLDPYTRAHLKDASMQIKKALDAHYVYRSL